MTQIASIVYKPIGAPEEPVNDYLRLELDEARLVPDYGIEGDAKGGHPNRQLNLMSYETLTNLRVQGFYTEPGQLGEQIVIHQLDVDNLPPGTRLQFGAQACVEVIKPRTGCERFYHLQRKPQDSAAGLLGVMAKVITGGLIRVGDPVQVLKPESHV